MPCSQRGWDCKGAGAASAAACSWDGSGEGVAAYCVTLCAHAAYDTESSFILAADCFLIVSCAVVRVFPLSFGY